MTDSKSSSDSAGGAGRLHAPWSRPGGRWALLAAALVLLLALAERPTQEWLRLELFDAYQRALPRERVGVPEVVVAIDERSLQAYGQWPWPRSRLAAIIDRIAAASPAAIGIDIFMPEPDRLSPRRLAEAAQGLDAQMAAHAAALPDSDALLARAIAGRPVVLGVGGLQHDRVVDPERPLPTAPMLLRGDPAGATALIQFDSLARSLPQIEAAAAGHGLLSGPLDDGRVHRMPLLARIGDVLMPALALELWRVAAGVPAIEATFDARGLAALRIGDLELPARADGTVWLRYARHDPRRYISAHDLLEGHVEPQTFERKLVLVAVTGLGLIDQLGTPIDARVPGIEVHAQLLENIYERSWLSRPSWARWLEAGALLLLMLLTIVVAPVVSPRRGFILFLVALLALWVAGLLAFALGLLLDVATPMIGASAVFAVVLAATLAESQRQRRELAAQLQAEREAAARLAGELEAARRVQIGMLPDARLVGQAESRLALQAWMEPARLVGGDLYDFFALDAQRWCVLIGDVSGKGLPAALFMALVKAQCQGALLRHPDALDRALRRAEAEIARHNPESMFVTLLVLVLDVASGAVEYCNAGHEPPWLLTARNRMPSALDGASRPPVGVLDGYPFEIGRHQLGAGDLLVLITDGVTEAMDRAGRLYGRDRLETLLRAAAGDSPAELAQRVRQDIEKFGAGAEQADDVAVVVVRWNGQNCRDS